jgi:hypothetical protein
MLVGSCAGAVLGLLAQPQTDDPRAKLHGLFLAAAGIAVGTSLGLALGVVREVREAAKPEAARASAVSVAGLFVLHAVIALACVGAFYAWSLASVFSVAATTTPGD